MSKWEELGSEIGRLIMQKLGEKGIDESYLKALSDRKTFNPSRDGGSGGGKPDDCGKGAYYDELLNKHRLIAETDHSSDEKLTSCDPESAQTCVYAGEFCAWTCLNGSQYAPVAIMCPTPQQGVHTCEEIFTCQSDFICAPSGFDCEDRHICRNVFFCHDGTCGQVVGQEFHCSPPQGNRFMCSEFEHGFSCYIFTCTEDDWFTCSGDFMCSDTHVCAADKGTFRCDDFDCLQNFNYDTCDLDGDFICGEDYIT